MMLVLEVDCQRAEVPARGIGSVARAEWASEKLRHQRIFKTGRGVGRAQGT